MDEYICADLSERPGCKVSPFWERRERIVRCRDCGFVRRDGDDICCARSLRLDERGVSRLSLVRLDGFCAWGEPRKGGGWR